MSTSVPDKEGQSSPAVQGAFRRFSQTAAKAMGSSAAFILALFLVVGWALAGPFYGYSDSWELVINTGTSIVTFLMVFVIQNSQNRDAMAMDLKLAELVRAVEGARNSLVDLENRPDEELHQLKEEFARLSEEPCELLAVRKQEVAEDRGGEGSLAAN